MSDLASLYAEVVAKRPEAAVRAPHPRYALTFEDGRWLYRHDDPSIEPTDDDEATPDEASALILQHWSDLLPEGFGVMRLLDNPHRRYTVVNHGDVDVMFPVHRTTLAALAAYLIGAK